AKSGLHDEVEALDTGADDFLSKPFSFMVLVARLRALLRRSATLQPLALEVGSLVLDPSAPLCRRGDTQIELPPRESAGRELLVRSPRQVVTRPVRRASGWGRESPGTWNVTDVYIRSLRRKADEPFGSSSIQTVRGAGYRVVEDG